MEVKVISKPLPREERKLKACAYVRVSTEKEAQLHSFSVQQKYWSEYIKANPNYEYIGIFSDEGISGKNMKSRAQFLKMLELAKSGEISLICTKSVSRFGRNLTEMLTTVRELREKGVTVYFEKENIYSDDPSCDMMLSLWAMVAEEELNSISENQKWAARKRYANGSVELTRIYGYDVVKENGRQKLAVNPQEAEIVKRIYKEYLDGYGFEKIAKCLDKESVPTKMGKTWTQYVVRYILSNEKYAGDALLQKSYKDRFQKVFNSLESPQVAMHYVEGNHEPVIDRETFKRVQEMLRQRSKDKPLCTEENPFKGIIYCGICGGKYRHRIEHRYKRKVASYSCNTYQRYGKDKCPSHTVEEETLFKLYLSAYNEWVDIKVDNDKLTDLENGIEEIKLKDKELYNLMMNGYIAKFHYETEHTGLTERLKRLEEELRRKSSANLQKAAAGKVTAFGAELTQYLDKVTVTDYTVTFKFINGVEIQREFEQNRGGNIKGWKQQQ